MPDNSYRTSNLGPRVSHATTKAFTEGPGHYLIPSWMTFETDGPANLDGLVKASSGLSASRLTVTGAANVTGAFTASGNANITGSFAVGSGVSLALIQRSIISVTPGAIAPFDSVSTTATIQTMPADALILGVQQASIWSGAYYDISVNANVSAASTLLIGLVNSTLTSVTPDAMNWTITWADPS